MCHFIIHRPLRRFLRMEHGSVALQFGLASAALVGVAALAVDFTGANMIRAKLRNAADTAAIAGAKVIVAEGTQQEAEGVADDHLAAAIAGINVDQSIEADVTEDNERVTVELTSERSSMVGSLLGGPMTVGVGVTARLGPPNGAPICVHALHGSMARAIDATGGTSIDAQCDVFVNSTSSGSIKMTGGGGITANAICVHGGVDSGVMSPSPQDCGVRADPFASISPTTPSTCGYTNYSGSSGTYTLNPGVYCGGLNLTGGPNVTLNPGTYVIRNGQLKMSGGGSMTGTGVTFVFEGTSHVDLSGGGTYHLVAPTTGPFKSFVFFQRPSANPGAVATMKGGGGTYFEGIIYFPTWETVINGGGVAATPSPFSAYIARSFRAVGGSTISFVWDPDRVTVPVPWRLFREPRSVYLSK
jgi:Flp pilus assembly protein TadG